MWCDGMMVMELGVWRASMLRGGISPRRRRRHHAAMREGGCLYHCLPFWLAIGRCRASWVSAVM